MFLLHSIQVNKHPSRLKTKIGGKTGVKTFNDNIGKYFYDFMLQNES